MSRTPFDDLTKEELQEMVEYCEKELKGNWKWEPWHYGYCPYNDKGTIVRRSNINDDNMIPLPLMFQWMKLEEWDIDYTIIPDKWGVIEQGELVSEHDGWFAFNTMDNIAVSLIGAEEIPFRDDRYPEAERLDHDNPHYLGMKAHKWMKEKSH